MKTLITSLIVNLLSPSSATSGTGHSTTPQNIHVNTTHISSSKVIIKNRHMGNLWDSHFVPLWPTYSWKSLKSRPSILPPIHLHCGLGMWMTPLSSKWQNKAANSCNTSTPLTHSFSSLRRFLTQRVPFLF